MSTAAPLVGGTSGEIDELVYADRWTQGTDGVWRCGDLAIGLNPDDPQHVVVTAQPGRSAGLHRAPETRVVNHYLPLEGYDTLNGPRDLIGLLSHEFANYNLPEPPEEGLADFYAAAEPNAVDALEEVRAEALAEAEDTLARLPGRTAAQLLDEVPEEPDWIVPGLLARRWAIKLAGREKDGKGTLVYYLLGRLERGEPTVFGPASSPVTSLVYTEEPDESVREKVESFGLQQSRIVYGYELADVRSWPEKVNVLVGTAVAEGHDLLFVDNVSRATGVEDENGVEFARAVEILIDSARAAGITCVFDHHHKKGKDRVENKSRGGTGVAGAMDVNVELSHVGDWTSRRRKLSARGRLRATIWEMTIELDEAGTDYTVVAGAEDGPRDEAAEAEADLLYDRMILRQVADANAGVVTARKFADAIERGADTARNRLNALVDDGYATKDPVQAGKTHTWSSAASEGSESNHETQGGQNGFDS